MQMLGKQCCLSLLSKGGIAASDFKNVLDAHRANKTKSYFDIGLDAFMLGYIWQTSRKK